MIVNGIRYPALNSIRYPALNCDANEGGYTSLNFYIDDCGYCRSVADCKVRLE